MVKIYALIDPNTNKIRYIGKTIKKLKIRLVGHLKDNKYPNNPKLKWLNGLKINNQRPIIRLIKRVKDKDWIESEIYHINLYRKLGRLTNISNGGEGAGRMSDETKLKLSILQKGISKPNNVHNAIPIKATNIITGESLNFLSTAHAVRELSKIGINIGGSNISKCLRKTKTASKKHQRITAKGFYWERSVGNKNKVKM
jgi:hypothetical protein